MSNALAHVQTLYVGDLTGEPQFGRKLIQALRQMGRFELIEERSRADAVLSAHGADQGEGFVGDLTIQDGQGAVLWSAHALRPHGSSGPMAYERLIAQLHDELMVGEGESRPV